MAVLNVYNLAGDQTGTLEVNDAVFGIEPNKVVLHEVLTAELAAARQGTASTKTRAMVRGGISLTFVNFSSWFIISFIFSSSKSINT